MAILPTDNELMSSEQEEMIDHYIKIEMNDYKNTTVEYLDGLLSHYMLKVPFENISVQNKEEVNLTLDGLYDKIISNHRGGYCYEMNTFFKHYLLKKGFIAFNTSATIITPKGRSREGSHMTTIVEIDNKSYIADVGFGDLPMKAIPICNKENFETVTDVNGTFRAIQINGQIFVQKLVDGEYKTKYEASIYAQELQEFKENIEFNQYNPESIFVKQLLITMPNPDGRKTMTHRQLTITDHGEKTTFPVNKDNYRKLLEDNFGLNIEIKRIEEQ